MSLPSLPVLDFDQIKAGLKTYLQSQATFSDYNFDGAGLNVLLDLLAYNTFWQVYYLHQVSGEMFLDTAQQRASIVSLAQALGYTPRSATAATATVNVVLPLSPQPGDPSSVTPIAIPAGTTFQAELDGLTYPFVTRTGGLATCQRNLTTNQYEYVANNLPLTQGIWLTQTFLAGNTSTFLLPNALLDTTTLTVQVQASNTDPSAYTCARATDTSVIGANDAVYWLSETVAGGWNLTFGDDILGRKLAPENLVLAKGIICAADAPNEAATFTCSTTFGGLTVRRIDTVSAAQGGAVAEGIEAIRFLAPRQYATQGRCVTADDYKTTLLHLVAGIRSVAVWGGEQGDPTDPQNRPAYGKVFISIQPTNGQYLSRALKQQIFTQVLRPRAVVTVTPDLIDPDYLYLKVTSVVKYDSTLTSDSAPTVQQTVAAAIQTFAATTLSRFDSFFRYSRLARAIDDSHPAVLNSLTTVTLKKLLLPTLGVSTSYTLNFGNAFYDAPSTMTVWSPLAATFSHGDSQGVVQTGCFLESVPGTTTLRIMRFDSTSTKVVVQPTIGTLTPAQGILQLQGFAPTALAHGLTIPIFAVPASSDVLSKQNQLILLDPNDVGLVLVDDAVSPGAAVGGSSVTSGGATLTLPGA
jgi:hypothetical protein